MPSRCRSSFTSSGQTGLQPGGSASARDTASGDGVLDSVGRKRDYTGVFVDQIRIYARAGDGGNGCVSFRREKFVPKGGPDGGDGGRGGDVVLQADPHTDNLVALYYEPVIRAKRGEHGKGKAKYGKSGVSTVVKVPQGTLVYQLPRRLGPNRPPEEGEEESRPKPKINPACGSRGRSSRSRTPGGSNGAR